MSDSAQPPNAPSERPTGLDVIKGYLRTLPGKPGVYRMHDVGGELLYVGKAKKLKNRVSSYARFGGHTNRIARMISETASMEFTVTNTETEALLLESNLIKRKKPKYNVIFRDDKSFPYILIRRDHRAPQLVKHRGGRAKDGTYFGPFASAGAVNRTLDTLQKAFLIRTCSDSVYENRSRPCMLHQIKRCAAPCVDLVSLETYGALVDDAQAFLEGKSDTLRKRLQTEMEAAAEALDFETAAKLRDRIRALAPIMTAQGINPRGIEEADVIAIAQEGGRSCVQAFVFRAGQSWGNRAFFPRHDKDASPGAIIAAFLGQYYDDKPAPRLILLSHAPEDLPLIEEALSLRAERKVEVTAPQRGEKAGLVRSALTNAEEALSRELAESAAQAELLDGVARAFDLPERPNRIEVYDNSHIQGAKAVGGMVVAGPEGFDKRAYRTFNIKSEDLVPGDDYGMMREVLRRRFARLVKERGDAGDEAASEIGEESKTGRKPDAWPDLVLIDGGKGQLSATLETLAELGLGPEDVNLVAIAKGPDRNAGREQFFIPGRSPFQLPTNDAVLYYLQRLRDEAHRFAIGTHRAKRSKDIQTNPLDEIPGVGPGRKKALLAHFGSARSVKRANLNDLERVEGVSKALARKIYDWFREG